MKIRLDYGKDGLWVELPDDNLAGIVERPPVGPADDPGDLVKRALREPIGTAPLGRLAEGRQSACVVVPDVTRPMPNRAALPPVLEAIEQAGLRREHIVILVATGLHRPNRGVELDEMLGADIAGRYRIVNHFAQDEDAHILLGATATGIPIKVDSRYFNAGLKVLMGLVEPHFMAGYSGGRKLVCPGICAADTIRAFHSPDLVEHPRSTNCVLDGNPTHLASTEAAERAGVDFMLNVVLGSDRRVDSVFAGELNAAFVAASDRARAVTTAPIDAPADIVVVTGGGYPLDATWYQSIKGLAAAEPAVRNGGTVLIAAALDEGIGSPAFARLIDQTADLQAFMRRIMQPDFFRSEQWQLEKFAHVARKCSILLCTDGIPREKQEKLFVTPVASVEEGITRALKRHGDKSRILVLPHGPYVLPIVT